MHADDILAAIHALASGGVRESMERFGISVDRAVGVTTPQLKSLARKIGKSHALAAELWKSGLFEARAVAALIDEPDKVTKAQMERWVKDFDSWAICDGCCCYLFRCTPFAWEKAAEWSGKSSEFVKRAGFALMAYLAVHEKTAADDRFQEFLKIIERASDDDRNFVRKAVNWALRQIGKRNKHLNGEAVKSAEAIRQRGSKSARWIAADALRELKSAKVRSRMGLIS